MSGALIPERDLVCRAQAGDEGAYRELVGRYLRPALAVAWEFTETIEDAEDVVQEAFRRAIDALDRFDAGRPFAPWFFTILRNVARNVGGRRALQLQAAMEETVPDERPTPEELTEHLELQARVDLELETLPEMQRVCFRLCVLEGFTSTEVAEALNLNQATVRTHVYRARQTIRTALMPLLEDDR
jgi:RNA polymerase sigma-70 factor (ECF subfamily)